MPRKVDPRRGEDGYEKDPVPITPGDAEVEALATMLGIDPPSSKVEELRSAVIDIGNAYRRWKRRGAGAFDRAQARRALEELLAADRIDNAAVTALNERALHCLLDSLLMASPSPAGPGDCVTVALFEDRIDEAPLRDAVRDAVARLKATKGPDRDGDLAWAVTELCRLYEEMTGRPATHSSKGEHMAYEQEPRSEAGRFVRECFRSIDDGVGAAKISRAMRHFIKGRG